MKARSRCIGPDDPTYPKNILDLLKVCQGNEGEALPYLYVRGGLSNLPGVAVVGTRKPSAEAVAFTYELVQDLVEAGLCIWSGGAMGIDGAAHEAALLAGGATVVVMGGGLDRPYPPQHRELFARVLARGEAGMGALMARVPDEVPPLPIGFCKRNELLAAGTEATVVIQAGYKSGARNTAAAARRLGRLLFAVPYAPWDVQGQGCALELAQGAKAVTCAADVLAGLAAKGLSVKVPRRAPLAARAGAQLSLGDAAGGKLPLPVKTRAASKRLERRESTAEHGLAAQAQIPQECEALFSVLTQEPLHIDEICEKIQGSAHRVIEGLLTLTLLAVVVEEPVGFYRRRADVGDMSAHARAPPNGFHTESSETDGQDTRHC